ncbi:MAG: site-2 protease family protein [Polyangiaceae bacterium]|nr:site-2 protease family protein [Polyangiaceae bacterium]
MSQPDPPSEPSPPNPSPNEAVGNEMRPGQSVAPNPAPPSARRFDWRINVALFFLTVLSVFYAGQFWGNEKPNPDAGLQLLSGWHFAVPLLSILLAHEFGHYIAARLHRVPTSLPYFLPLPAQLSPFGTFGAVIIMPERIKTRRALMDIGAAGPLAGLLVAIPVMLHGLSLSTVEPKTQGSYIQEGQSILYWLLKYAVHGSIPAGHDVFLHPTALAAWVGFLVTFLNLLPVGQLDGGHVAYALFGERQNAWGKKLALVPWLLVLYNVARYVMPILARGNEFGFNSLTSEDWNPVSAAMPWVVSALLLSLLGRLSGRGHPPVEDTELGPGRRLVGWVTLGLFVLLFMPTPMVFY